MNNQKLEILESEQTLLILKEIASSPAVSQRYLAKKLEISLGKINFFINALIKKGIIEAKNFKNSKHKLAYMYLLTAQGIKLKFQLTYKFFVWKMEQYERLRKEIEDFKREIENNKEVKAAIAPIEL